MTVYVDDLFATRPNSRWPFKQACHMTADHKIELLNMARDLGLRDEWLQDAGLPTEHFDLTANKRREAIAHGAQEISWRQAAEKLRNEQS